MRPSVRTGNWILPSYRNSELFDFQVLKINDKLFSILDFTSIVDTKKT